MYTRREFLRVGVGAAGAASLASFPLAVMAAPTVPLASLHPATVAVQWFETLFQIVKAERTLPPAAARLYAHLGVALYEGVVKGVPGARSLGGQLNRLGALPNASSKTALDWPTVATASASTVLTHDLATRSDALASVAALRATALAERRAIVGADIVAASAVHGDRIGASLIGWITTDGWAGTVGKPYDPPTGDGLWQRTPPNFGGAIEPHWGEVRFLALDEVDACRPLPHVAFSSETGSAFWHQANATYQAHLGLTDEQRATALYWRDNPDGSTGLPSGHWMLIATQVITDRGLDLGRAAEVLALVGIALADGFSSCWREKYRSNLLRPVTYIQRYIDPNWASSVNSPAFPEYTSGHSVGSGAAAEVLTAVFGRTRFTDTAVEFTGHTPRTFSSFAEAADEAAISRLYGGIHYPMAIENGLDQGRCVGRAVMASLRTTDSIRRMSPGR